MNKKLLKQIVNERRSNAWLFVELLLVSIVLWYVVDYMFVTLYTYFEPRGFDIGILTGLNLIISRKKAPII